MKFLNNLKSIYLSTPAIPMVAICLFLLVGCKEDNDDKAFFAIKDNLTTLQSTADGTAQTITVQSSGNWKVEPLRKEHWVKIEPMEGNGDGTFTITVLENMDEEARELPLFFKVNDRLQDAVLKISQDGALIDDSQKESYVNFDSNLMISEIPEAGLTQNTIIRATGKWRMEIEEGQDWVTFSQTEGEGDTPISMTVARNTDIVRQASITFYLNEVQYPTPIIIAQKGVKLQVVGDVVFTENFNWLTYGSEIFATTTGEARISTWTTDQLAKGWTSTINTTEGGGSYASTYARQGFIKLGRTNYGGDIISPKLENVQRTKNLLVTFKAVRHGANDHYLLTVGVNGPGTVSRSSFDIMNYANPNNTSASSIAAWQASEATYSFVINGATKDTQIWFLGGAFDQRSGNWPSTTNRIYLDDIEVIVTN
ncbi:MAG: BACON domain-containing protein [Sphingobacterium composti]|uniref:BACON domain-containing protein n=1 Tax=Sphingobacterium composti TaxID=363260 RepID=UPI00135C4A73|nr:BACON domain-containing carbohydrate-binding protein [Sphingobacterium composti Ten et al. 2007 non Yoo et al. 2007]